MNWYEDDSKIGVDPELAKLSKEEIDRQINEILKAEGKIKNWVKFSIIFLKATFKVAFLIDYISISFKC